MPPAPAVFCLPMPLARWVSAARIVRVPGAVAPLPTLHEGVEFAELIKFRALHCLFFSVTPLYVRLRWTTLSPFPRCVPTSPRPPFGAPLLPLPLPLHPQPPQCPPVHSRSVRSPPRTAGFIGHCVDDQDVLRRFTPSVPRGVAFCTATAAAAVSTTVRMETA